MAAEGEHRYTVAALDLGIKRNVPRRLAARGVTTHVLPATSTLDDLLATGADAVFFSPGPGDPATADHAVSLAAQVMRRRIPLFGICFGSQILGRALGFGTYKLGYGHRGINQPVLDRTTGKVEVTSHNHGFAVDAPLDERVDTEFGAVAVSHVCLNDDVVEGLRAYDVPAFTVQYHPEAAAGPHDADYLFDRFARADLRRGARMPKRTDLRHVLVIGSGPIVIGQACEFDYSGTQACRVLRAEGLRVSLVNSNPATIMTDPEFADATYIEPITPEFVELVIARERPDAILRDAGRADGAEHGRRAARGRRPGQVRRRADRRRHRGHPARRGPAAVQGDRRPRRGADAALARLFHDGRGPRDGGRPRPARGRSGRASRWAASAPAWRTRRRTWSASPAPA